MDTRQSQQTEQRLLLTESMKQSLEVLQMALPELREYIQEQALSNPLLEVDENHTDLSADFPQRNIEAIHTSWRDEGLGDLTAWKSEREEWPEPASGSRDSGEDFTEQLFDQLLGMQWLDERMKAVCKYVILCLNDRGYLEFDLADLSAETGVPLFDMEQALYIVQSLQPTGVGARSLTECLLLQLAQGTNFNALTVGAARNGLELIAKNDAAGLAKLLCCTKREAQAVTGVIRSLNPIPSKGYGTAQPVSYQIPEAIVKVENGQLNLEINRRFLPRLSIDRGIAALLAQHDEDSREYLKKNSDAAAQLIRCVENRQSTMERLLKEIILCQQEFFLYGKPLKPMTMGELAERMGVNVSTVSRCVHGRTIACHGRTLLLRDLFTARITTAQGEELSSAEIKRQISRLVREETPAKPLSDESIRSALETMRFSISRRTVAKYREELGIPGSAQRKRR